jgi:hypothetical protein
LQFVAVFSFTADLLLIWVLAKHLCFFGDDMVESGVFGDVKQV